MTIPDPVIYEIGYKTYPVNERGMDNFYVLVGEERGLVVDCGAGSFDTRSVVDICRGLLDGSQSYETVTRRDRQPGLAKRGLIRMSFDPQHLIDPQEHPA